MQAMHTGPDGDGVTVGTVRISRRFVAGVLFLFAALACNHLIRLASGSTSWFGYVETSVSASAAGLGAPYGDDSSTGSLMLSIPMPAQPGQEVVVHYDLRTVQPGQTNASVTITCDLPCNRRTKFPLDGPATGELILPVTDTDFYRVSVTQGADKSSQGALGTFWIGVRNSRS